MKLSLTIIAIAFALTNAPAFAEEWDMQPEVREPQIVAPVHAPVLLRMQTSSETQFDLSSLQASPVENTPELTSAIDTEGRAATTEKTSTQTPSGLPQCCTSIMGQVTGPTSEKGLPQCSLATLSNN